MKKFIAILLMLVMCVTLSLSFLACEKKAKEDETEAGEEEVVEEGGEEEAGD